MARKIALFAIIVFSVLVFPTGSAFASSGNYRVSNVSWSGLQPLSSEVDVGHALYSFKARSGFERASSPSFRINLAGYPAPLDVGDHIHLAYVFVSKYAVPSCPAPLSNSFYQLNSCTLTSLSSNTSSLNGSLNTTNPSNGSIFLDSNSELYYRVELDFEITKKTQSELLPMGGDFFSAPYTATSFFVEIFYDTVVISTPSLSADTQAVVGATDKQTQQNQEHFDKEQEQREEDKKASEDASNNSQSSSEDSQSEVDDASKNLFQILTEFVDAIGGSSSSSCSITGDFGFFNVGNIDLCTGASKVRPITTIVGTIMLIGLIIPAVITLLHRFVALYNEVTN